jgi:cell division protein FtsL
MSTARDQLRPERRLHPAGRGRRPAPGLRLVDEAQRSAADRRRARLALATAAIVACGGLFGVVSFHVVLTEGQLELERLQARAAAAEERNARLRLEVAELESPAWVVAAAQQRLGMVPPRGVTYLSPSGPTTGPR